MFKDNFRSILTRIEMMSDEEIKRDIGSSECISHLVLDYAIEANNAGLFSACIDKVDAAKLDSFFACEFEGKYWMARRVLKRIRNPKPKIMSDLVYNMMYDFNNLNLSLNDILAIQDCCEIVQNNKMFFAKRHMDFVTTMANLKKMRHKRVKVNMYYLMLQNVIMNPDHPIGQRNINAAAQRFYSRIY